MKRKTARNSDKKLDKKGPGVPLETANKSTPLGSKN
jgi:hypothetical protein